MGGVDRSILTLGYEVEPRSKMTDIHPLTISIIFELKFMLESQRSTKDKDDTLRRFMIGDCDPSIDLPPLAYVDRPAPLSLLIVHQYLFAAQLIIKQGLVLRCSRPKRSKAR